MSARSELSTRILAAKGRLGLSWKRIAESLGANSPIIYTAALLGQFPLTPRRPERLWRFWSSTPPMPSC